jgi:hypothetical protein
MGQVEGKVAIVTGGAYGLTAISSRMGSFTCGRMQERGHSHVQSLQTPHCSMFRARNCRGFCWNCSRR